MLQAWLSFGYIVLLAIFVLAFILWRRGAPVLAIAALVVGIPLWFGWEYARPTWTTGVITGTEVRRSDPDARGNTTDIEYIYMRNPSDRGLELINDDSWWWLKRNSERVFNDAKTAQSRNTEMTSCGIGGAPRSSVGTPTRSPSAPPAPGRCGRCEPSSSTASPSSSGSVISTPSSGCADRVRRCVIATPIVGRLREDEDAR